MTRGAVEEAPAVSVVVPSHGRPRQLAGCLESLAGLSFARRRLEVIVVDDGSPEPLEPVVAPFREALSATLLRQARRGPAAARNAGAERARGSLLAFLDDDCRAGPRWLEAVARAHASAPQRLLGGRTVNALDRNPYATASQVIVDAAYAHYNPEPAAARFFAANNLAAPAVLFRRLGGFDESFRPAAEDRELCDRWRHRGGGLLFVPDAVVYHAHDLDLAGFCRQHFAYGRGARLYHRRRELRGSGTLVGEALAHLRCLGRRGGPLAGLGPGRALQVAALLALWQPVNAAGFAYELVCGGVSGRASGGPPRAGARGRGSSESRGGSCGGWPGP